MVRLLLVILWYAPCSLITDHSRYMSGLKRIARRMVLQGFGQSETTNTTEQESQI